MKTVTGVFETTDAALRAGERVREVAGPRATVRVLLSGASGQVVETSILNDSASWLRVTLFGLGLGIICAIIAEALGASFSMGLVGVLAGALTGVMLGVWLTGEAYPRRIMARSGGVRFRYERELRDGRAVVTAVLSSSAAVEKIINVMEEDGGKIVDGFLHEAQGGALLPQS